MQVRPRPSDLEGRIPGIPRRRRLHHAAGFLRFAAVEQQAHQLHPVVPASVADRGEQQVTAPCPQPTFLVSQEEAPPLGGPVGIRILSEQLAEPEARRRIRR